MPSPSAAPDERTPDGVRIAMWSGPRNISTAMMRAFENRPDTAVVDEPFYAAYLAETGLDHPMRAEVLAAQPTDPNAVVAHLLGPVPDGKPVFYQKHMTHHMLPGFNCDWIARCRNAFLIRTPYEVLASYTEKRAAVTLADIGVVQQRELFERECERLGRAPPVIEARDVLADPRGMLSALCAALGIAFSDRMLAWPAGRRASDGVWGPAWYDAVERSTGFARPGVVRRRVALGSGLQAIAAAADPHYERLARFALSATAPPS
jgi:hypothetical protein